MTRHVGDPGFWQSSRAAPVETSALHLVAINGIVPLHHTCQLTTSSEDHISRGIVLASSDNQTRSLADSAPDFAQSMR